VSIGFNLLLGWAEWHVHAIINCESQHSLIHVTAYA